MSRHGDGLFKKGECWHFKYPRAGRWVQKTTGKRSFSEAKAMRADFLRDLRMGRAPSSDASLSVSAALERWLAYQLDIGQQSSHASRQTAIKHLLDFFDGKRRLESLTLDDLRDYQAHRRRQCAAPKTVNNEMLPLMAVLKRARLWHRFELDYKPLRVPKQGPGKALANESLARLVACGQSNPRWFVALWASVLAWSTGCRSWELKSLRLRDIDMANKLLSVRRETTKTDAGARELALNTVAVAALEQLLRRAELLGAKAPDHFLFPGDRSKHTKSHDPLRGDRGFDPTTHQASWSEAWTSLRKAAGLEGFRFHDLRHTHITRSVEAGVPPEVVIAQVGHVSLQMLRHYTHLAVQAKQHAASLFDAQASDVLAVVGFLDPPTNTAVSSVLVSMRKD